MAELGEQAVDHRADYLVAPGRDHLRPEDSLEDPPVLGVLGRVHDRDRVSEPTAERRLEGLVGERDRVVENLVDGRMRQDHEVALALVAGLGGTSDVLPVGALDHGPPGE